MVKSPENSYMCLGKYAYDPYIRGSDVFIRIAHRGAPDFIMDVKVVEAGVGYSYEVVSSTMPAECVSEFAETLQRNMSLLVRRCLNA